MIQNGGDPTVKDINNRGVYDIAVFNQHSHIALRFGTDSPAYRFGK